MSTTPNYFTRTMAAGARADVHGSARYLTIYSVTPGVVVEFGFNDDQLVVLGGPLTIDFGALGASARFGRVVFRNADALLPATVTGYFSNVRIEGAFSELNTLVAIQTLLTTIDADLGRLKPATAMTIVSRLTVPQIGAVPPRVQILAANPLRKWCMVTMDLANAGYVYLGGPLVTDVDSFFDSIAGGTWREHYTGAVWACSDNGNERVRAYETT